MELLDESSPDDLIPAICRLDYYNSARYQVQNWLIVNLEQVWSMGRVPFSAPENEYRSYSIYALLDANSRWL